jgi:hypothetical protein
MSAAVSHDLDVYELAVRVERDEEVEQTVIAREHLAVGQLELGAQAGLDHLDRFCGSATGGDIDRDAI